MQNFFWKKLNSTHNSLMEAYQKVINDSEMVQKR